jgi:hypothetical protein
VRGSLLDISYWDERYVDIPEPFDWLVSWSDVGPAVTALLSNKQARILMSG